ncbi:unnamed protein product [Calicophoron daubneyi]|uniref:Uncharacterized protein n=1 Tax=Calicophoron daubneyi TaxID=300641 RepID=A0AAV2TMR9_CALDB
MVRVKPTEDPSERKERTDYSRYLTDQRLFEVASAVRERWEDLFRQGLTVSGTSEKEAFDGAACLPSEQIHICRALAPKEGLIQCYHALARWRWFCVYHQCPEKIALDALVRAVNNLGIVELKQKLQVLSQMSASLEFV